MKTCNILHGTLVFPECLQNANIHICNGVIDSIFRQGASMPSADMEIDAQGMLLFPGLIDSHVHMRGGSFSYREDFTSGSRAALAAGVTTLFEMPGCAKPASTLAHFLEREKEVRRDGCADIALYGGAGADNLDEIAHLAEAGAVGFKTFQMPPVPGREAEFYGLCSVGLQQLTAVMRAVAATGLSLTIHCEDPQTIAAAIGPAQQRGARVRDFCASRPEEAELIAVERAVQAARATGCRTIVAHTSTDRAVKLISRARDDGVDIHSETCMQYLTFDCDSMDRFGVFARMKPPFRARPTVDRLIDEYRNGTIEITGSDHAPYTKKEKLQNGQDIWHTFDGLPALELTFPLLLRLVEQHRIGYETIARNAAERTAAIFGLPQKGRLEPGRDADIVFVRRLAQPQKLDIHRLLTKCRDCAVIYDGMRFGHEIVRTMSHGEIVFENGKLHAAHGRGRFLSGRAALYSDQGGKS